MSDRHELHQNKSGFHQTQNFDPDKQCAESSKVLVLWLLSASTLIYFAIHALL